MSLNDQNISTNFSTFTSARAVLSARGFSYLLGFEIILGASAALANVPLIVLIWRRRATVFHFNLRLLLCQLSIVLLCYSVGYAIRASILLSAIISADNDHSIITTTTNAYECALSQLPYTLPTSVSVCTLLAVSLERLYSTVRFKNYDERSTKWLGCTLAVMTWIVPVSISVLAIDQLIPTDQSVPICEPLLALETDGAIRVLSYNLSLIVSGLICTLICYFWNKHKLRRVGINRAQHTLASRFQIDQNVRVNQVILPSMLLVALCYLPNHAFMVVVMSRMKLSMESKIWFVHLAYVWKLAYALAHPILAFKRKRTIRKIAPMIALTNNSNNDNSNGHHLSMSASRNSDGKIARISEAQLHFGLLQQAWSVYAMRVSKSKSRVGHGHNKSASKYSIGKVQQCSSVGTENSKF